MSELVQNLKLYWRSRIRNSPVGNILWGPPVLIEHDGTDVDSLLYERLNREAESKDKPDVRKISVRTTEELADQLIALMFDLDDSRPGYQVDHRNDLRRLLRSAASKSIDRRAPLVLTARWKVFYTYYHPNSGRYSPAEISRAFYKRIFELAGMGSLPFGIDDRSAELGEAVTAAVKNFILEFLNSGVELSAAPMEEFDPNEAGNRNLFRNAFSCNFAVCAKNFPHADTQFIVGRKSIYDTREINQMQTREMQKWVAKNLPINETKDPTKVCVVYRYERSVQSSGGSKIRFNAHRFRSDDDELPKPEPALLISNLLTSYGLTAGFAEHDEINCRDWERFFGISLTGVQRGTGQWLCTQTPAELPAWMSDVTGAPEGSLFIRLDQMIEMPQVQPKIRLVSRILRRKGTVEEMEAPLLAECRALSPEAAVKITEKFWLVLSSDGKPYRFFRNAGRWERADVQDGVTFDVEGCRYFWKSAESDEHLAPFSDRYAGLMAIQPVDSEKSKYEYELSIDRRARPVPVSDEDNMFIAREIVNDQSLGRDGVVLIKCTDDADNKGKYCFMPQRQPGRIPLYPFFAVKRVMQSNAQPWPEHEDWVIYDSDDAQARNNIDEDGYLTYGGQRITAVRSSYLLLCGSSMFQIEISGTPGIKDFSRPRPRLALPAPAPPVDGEEPFVPPVEIPEPVAANEENIAILLQDTEYKAFNPRKIGRSNISLHVKLEKEGEESMFLKAFWPWCQENAAREVGFYERYKDRASELFIKPPLKIVPNDKNTTLPYALIFERLEERAFSILQTVSAAQAAALGYSLAVLHKALSDDGLINYDIDATNVCFEENGRICLIDFDNVFPLVTDRTALMDNLQKVGGLLKSAELPAKTDLLPPEAVAFNESRGGVDKEEALLKIDSSYGIYLIGGTLLTLLQVGREDKVRLTIVDSKFNKKFKESQKGTAKKLKSILKEMIRPVPSERPEPGQVVERLAEVIAELAKDDAARNEMEIMLGSEQLAKLVS